MEMSERGRHARSTRRKCGILHTSADSKLVYVSGWIATGTSGAAAASWVGTAWWPRRDDTWSCGTGDPGRSLAIRGFQSAASAGAHEGCLES